MAGITYVRILFMVNLLFYFFEYWDLSGIQKMKNKLQILAAV